MVLLLATLAARASVAVESGPQGIVRQFCQADALGRRVGLRGWPDVVALISWPFEPAWDSVTLITGYAVGSPRQGERGVLKVDVQYDVLGEVSAFGFETGVHAETVTFRVHAPEDGWRIIGPPPPPHVFASRVEIEAMRRSLEFGGLNFLPNSLFVFQMFRAAGWNVVYERVADMLSGRAYRAIDEPRAGDVVAYLHDGVAYHVGLLEADNQVVSSTLNAGIVRTAVDAFAGDVRYLRLIEPEPEPTPVRLPLAVKPPGVNQPSIVAQPSPAPRVEMTGRVTPEPRR